MGISYNDKEKVRRIRNGIGSYIEKLKKFEKRHFWIEDALKEFDKGMSHLDNAYKDSIFDPDSWKDKKGK